MIAREIHIAPPDVTAALSNVMRLAGTLLCLSGVAVGSPSSWVTTLP
jgi:hypothetical protein